MNDVTGPGSGRNERRRADPPHGRVRPGSDVTHPPLDAASRLPTMAEENKTCPMKLRLKPYGIGRRPLFRHHLAAPDPIGVHPTFRSIAEAHIAPLALPADDLE